MTDAPISVLIVEDDADGAFLIAHTLRREGGFSSETVDTLAGARRRLIDGKIDVVILDLNLPDSQGLDTLHGILRAAPDVTVVVVTGQLGEEMALQALNVGAEDYLLKGQIEMAVLGRTVRHAYERRRIQAAFGASERSQLLQETLSFEQLVATISNRFITIGPHELDRSIQEALERIGDFFGVERVALYEYSQQAEELGARFWLAEQNPGLGVWPTQEEVPALPELNAYLDQEGALVVNKIEDIPESWQAERRWVELAGSKALAGVRIELKGSFRGRIMLDSMWRPRQWAPDLVPRLRMLGELIAGTIVRQRAELEREQLLNRIQEQARAMQQLIETVPEGVILLARDGRILLANPTANQLLARLSAAEGDRLEQLGDRSLAELLVRLPRGEWHALSHDGYAYEITARPVRGDGEAGSYVLVIRDVTREREIKERAQQQDRLAAVGQLAAGVAHDFNNIMSVITLYASGTRYDASLPPELQKRLGIIQQQAQRAAALIEQILDFSRRAPLESLPVNLVTFLKEVVQLLQRTLPENIELEFSFPQQSLVVSADPTRMQQVIMNLAVNARDAMPEGGRLSIRLAELLVEQPDEAPLPGMEAGRWVRVTVGDTGSGVPEAALPHIFEPFYTTKTRGKGTGLGLAQVYGIVKQHGGEVDVRTREGEGTTFQIYLPALVSERREVTAISLESLPIGTGETILLVEDDDATRSALADTLASLGYHVQQAANGQEALALYQARAGGISLVISDVVMPVMGGQALFHALQAINPRVRIILLTGHVLDSDLQRLLDGRVHRWMRKPPRVQELAQTVAATLAA